MNSRKHNETPQEPIIIKHNKKNKKQKKHSTAWKIALADFMTTLMILFFILWVVSITPPEKKKALVSFFHGHFDAAQNGLMPNKNTSKDQPKSNNISKLYVSLESELHSEDKSIQINLSRGRIELNLESNVLFDSAQAKIKPAFSKTLSKIAKVIKEKNIYIDIYGYTDNLPIRQGNIFKNNLNLSISRAQSVANELIAKGINLDIIGVHGEGERFPIANNKTAAGREHNRRIVIYISPIREKPLQSLEDLRSKEKNSKA